MIPQFKTIAERLEWFRENKGLVMATKMAIIKKADAVHGISPFAGKEAERHAVKELGTMQAPVNGILYVKAAINTTNLLDSHWDVHIPGIWKKTLNETTYYLHLQEHDLSFNKVISDEVTAYTKTISWKSLGYAFDGSTQALVYDSTVREKRNSFMFEQYASGYVKQHSVGMRYVKMFTCVNSEEKYWAEEKDNWDKYYPMVANKDMADELGMFFAVTEAKLIEGSAVVLGSNCCSPTMECTEAADEGTSDKTIEPEQSTQTTVKRSRFATIGDKIK